MSENKKFTDSESKKVLKAFETISNYCDSKNVDCFGCVFANTDEESICLFQDSVWMSDCRISSITKTDILKRATGLR